MEVESKAAESGQNPPAQPKTKKESVAEQKADALLEETVEEKKQKSLRYSIVEGFGDNFISAFAIALNATNLQLGLIASLPQLVGAWAKLVGVRLLDELKNRKKIMLSAALLNGLVWIPIMLTPFVFREHAVWALLVLFSLYQALAAIISPSWNSLMGDLVGEKERGSYFGKRNAWVSFGGFTATLVGGFMLQLYGMELLLVGFASLFLIAFAFRMTSWYFMGKMYEAPYEQKPESYFSLAQFISAMPSRKFGYFTLFVGAIMVSVSIASPFFAPHLLNTLHFDYFQYTIILAASILATIISMPHWGKLLDDFGTRSVIILTSIMIVLVPLLWVLSGNFYYLALVEMFSGFAWAGFNLSVITYLFDAVTPQKRARCVAYHSIVIATLSFVGGIVGANAANNLGPLFSPDQPYLTVFAFSALLRTIAVLLLFSALKEVRVVKPISERQLFFKSLGVIPFNKIGHDIVVLEKSAASEMRKEVVFIEEELEKEIEKITKRKKKEK